MVITLQVLPIQVPFMGIMEVRTQIKKNCGVYICPQKLSIGF